jgi:hypothetical protein
MDIKITSEAISDAVLEVASSAFKEFNQKVYTLNNDLVGDTFTSEAYTLTTIGVMQVPIVIFLFLDNNGNYRITSNLECEVVRQHELPVLHTNVLDEEFNQTDIDENIFIYKVDTQSLLIIKSILNDASELAEDPLNNLSEAFKSRESLIAYIARGEE